MINDIFAVLFTGLVLVLFAGAMLIVQDKQREWEARHRERRNREH